MSLKQHMVRLKFQYSYSDGSQKLFQVRQDQNCQLQFKNKTMNGTKLDMNSQSYTRKIRWEEIGHSEVSIIKSFFAIG